MTTRGKSRLARRFELVMDAHSDQLPKVAERSRQLGLEMGDLEKRIVWLEEHTLRGRLVRAWRWLVGRIRGRQESNQAG